MARMKKHDGGWKAYPQLRQYKCHYCEELKDQPLEYCDDCDENYCEDCMTKGLCKACEGED